MQNGGKREGAGRKKAPHTLEAEKARAFIIQEVAKHLKPLLVAQLDLALGHAYEDKDGKIYTKSPDPKAIQDLLDRAFGKAQQNVNLGDEDGKPLELNVIITSVLDKVYGDKQ